MNTTAAPADRLGSLLLSIALVAAIAPEHNAQKVRTQRVSVAHAPNGAPFQPGNLVTTSGRVLREYTRTGEYVRGFAVPHPDTSRYDATDTVIDREGRAHVLNLAPLDDDYISTLDPVTGTWEHHPIFGFLGNAANGDLHIRGDTLYTKHLAISLKDFSTVTIPEPTGRSVSEYVPARTGTIYGVSSGSPQHRIWEINPTDHSLIRELELRDARGFRLQVTGLAILPGGAIHAADLDGAIYHFNANGTFLRSVVTGSFRPNNMDVAYDGAITIGASNGNVVLTDTSLSPMMILNGGVGTTYSGFVPPKSIRIDFDRTVAGDPMGTNGLLVSGGGLFMETVQVDGVGVSGGNAALFDSTALGPNRFAEDEDLLVDKSHVLILQENPDLLAPGLYRTPDDDRLGGTLTFTFPGIPVAPRSIDLIDICPGSNESATVTLADESGRKRTYVAPAGWTEDRVVQGGAGWRTLDLRTLAPQAGFISVATASEDAGFDPGSVIEIKVTLGGSGAVDDLVFQP